MRVDDRLALRMIRCMSEDRPCHPPAVPEQTALPAWRVAGFAIAWLLPLGLALAVWRSPATAALVGLAVQGLLALAERLHPGGWRWEPEARPAYRWVLRIHVGLQAGLLALALVLAGPAVSEALRAGGAGLAAGVVLSLGLAVGLVSGSQGITYAHELGHSRSRGDRLLAWLLMGSVAYSHFMVEHYRGHHVRVATDADPASAPAGMSLWRFLPRTLLGSWRSAWALERQGRRARRLPLARSPLVWAQALQVAFAGLLLAVLGPAALAVWLVQAAYAVFLLETINYIEHYGLRRRERHGRPEPFAAVHAWNADRPLTNLLVANLQRHSDHHLHPHRPYETLRPLPSPQLPSGYAGCIFLALWPPVWFRLMHPRLQAWSGDAAAPADAQRISAG